MSLLPRPELRTLPSGHHGGIDYAEAEALGLDPGEMLDFSANLNPFGPPPGVARAVAGAELSQYPDSRSRRLTLALAEKLGVQPDRILPTSGSTELIRLAALAYFGKGDRVLIIEPTFDEYELACCIAGASVVKQRLSPHDEFQLDTAETVKLIRRHRPKGIFICNPNNPTGRYFSRSEFQEILAAAGDCLVTLDEAYLSFVDSPWSSLEMPGRSNVLVLRSMTKDYAMAGLRLGYGVAAPDIIATLRRVCPPWNVNSPAQRAGIAALRHDHYLERCQRKLKRAKRYLESELSALGLPPLPSEANFFLVDVGDAGAFRQSLLQKRMLVRDCSSFGLPHHIRIAPRTLSDCRRLVAAIKEIGPGKESNE